MTTMTVFGTSRSRAFRVLWAMKELQMPFEHKPIDWQTCRTDPSYLAINPAGSVPCIKEGDFVLSESLAINLYLTQRTGKLWPATEQGRAAALQWSLWAATSLEEPYIRWALHEQWLPVRSREPELARSAMINLERPLERLENALSKAPWLVEGAFTVADLNVASVISLLNGPSIEKWPQASRWLAACVQRQAFRDAARLP